MKRFKRFVTINGKKSDKIDVYDHGFLYGDGIFETFRIIKGRIFRLEDHLDRLFESAKLINLHIPYSRKKLISFIKKTYNAFKQKDAFIRMIITRGVGEQGIYSVCKPSAVIIASEREFKPLKKVSAHIFKIRRTTALINPQIKHLNYSSSILALNEAKKIGKEEAILTNESGNISEATTSNVFMVKNGQLITPSLNSGILPGITRKAIIDNFSVMEKEVTVKDLLSADEVFLTGSVNFIVSVSQIDSISLDKFDYAKKVFDKLINSLNKEKFF